MMKKKRRGRVLLAAVILMLLASCRITDVSEGERKELSYAIVKPGDFPPEIDQILRRKKESAFQMAYESGDDLYILRGYGKQKSGGFSIQIEEVSKSENAVFVRTKTRRTCRKGGAERHRLLPLRRAENESGGGNLSRI